MQTRERPLAQAPAAGAVTRPLAQQPPTAREEAVACIVDAYDGLAEAACGIALGDERSCRKARAALARADDALAGPCARELADEARSCLHGHNGAIDTSRTRKAASNTYRAMDLLRGIRLSRTADGGYAWDGTRR